MQEKYTNAFLISGEGSEDKNFALELTYNYGKSQYNVGSGFGHFALRVPDVYKTVDAIKQSGRAPAHDLTHELKGGFPQGFRVLPKVLFGGLCALGSTPHPPTFHPVMADCCVEGRSCSRREVALGW